MQNSLTVVGLTGPLASGKSAVAVELAGLGAAVLDTDRAVHQLQRPGTEVTAAIVAAVGQDILDVRGAVCRETLAKRVIADTALLPQLEQIIYPALFTQVQDWLATVNVPVAVVEAPLLFEAGLEKLCDVRVACLCPPDLRRKRALQRPGMTEAKYETLAQRQKTDADFAALCPYTLDTGTAMRQTAQQLETWMTEWTR